VVTALSGILAGVDADHRLVIQITDKHVGFLEPCLDGSCYAVVTRSDLDVAVVIDAANYAAPEAILFDGLGECLEGFIDEGVYV
jgi:hypothetical protein